MKTDIKAMISSPEPVIIRNKVLTEEGLFSAADFFACFNFCSADFVLDYLRSLIVTQSSEDVNKALRRTSCCAEFVSFWVADLSRVDL